MFNSSTIDLVLGMVFIYLLLSLVVSTLREGIESRLRTRPQHLARGIAQLLVTPAAAEIFYAHPLVKSLYDISATAKPAIDRTFKGLNVFAAIPALLGSLKSQNKLPSYVPRKTFAVTVMHLVASNPKTFLGAAGRFDSSAGGALAPKDPNEPATGPSTPGTLTVQQVMAVLDANPNNPLAQSLKSVLATSGDDLDKAIDALGAWYDGTMDRVAGWYKRESQHIMFWLGVMVAVGMNVDSLFLIKYLKTSDTARYDLAASAALGSKDPTIRPLVASQQLKVASAASAPATSASDVEAASQVADARIHEALKLVSDLNLPIGWTAKSFHTFLAQPGEDIFWALIGWLFTAFALSLGAPFWFDMLNKVMVVRSTVKPSEKSPDKAPDEPAKKP